MPVMDGITMLKKMREDAWEKNVNVIILTNLSDNEKVASAMAEGSYTYLVKSSWQIGDVVKKVRERLGTPRDLAVVFASTEAPVDKETLGRQQAGRLSFKNDAPSHLSV